MRCASDGSKLINSPAFSPCYRNVTESAMFLSSGESTVSPLCASFRKLIEISKRRSTGKKIIVWIINGGERPGETLVLTTVDYRSVDLCVAKFLEGRQYPLADVDGA